MRYVATQFGPWRVNHDAAGKIVVRSVTSDEKEVVIATARWSDNGSIDRLQTRATVPGDDSWAGIDEAVRVALAAASNMPPDTRLDAGELPKSIKGVKPSDADKPGPLDEVAKGSFAGYVILALLAAGAIGLFFTLEHFGVLNLLPRSGKANGDQCKYDSDCRSDSCDFGRCQAGKRERGDRCDRDSECSSGDCRLHLCD